MARRPRGAGEGIVVAVAQRVSASPRFGLHGSLRYIHCDIKLENIMIRTDNQKNKFKIFIKGNSSFYQKFEKESELDLELSYIP